MILTLLLAGLAFLLGRFSVSTPVVPSAGVPSKPVATSSSAASALPAPLIATSTAAMCPCPLPKKKVAKSLALTRKKAPPVATEPFVPPDVTAATAKYLKETAMVLAECAPSSGGEVRIHLEVTVSPAGEIEGVKITNLEPLPNDIVTCVEERVNAFEPPGFDATDSETFALTVVI